MASKIKVDQIEGSTGSSITIPSGQTLTITDGLAASTIGSGTLADARIPNLNASKITAGTIATARLGSGTASSSTFLRGDGTFAEAGGGLVQVKHVATTTQHNLASNSFQDLNNMSLSITPTSASNKIFMMFGINGYTNVGNRGWKARIQRGSTTIFEEPEQKATYSATSAIVVRTMYHYIDSPNTTSATTYKAQVHQDGGGEIYYQYGGSQSFITLMEVSV